MNANEMGLFNYDVNLEPQTIDIRSETLEPISSSKYRYVFRLDQAGQLDSNSLLLFKPVRVQGVGTVHNYRVNPYAGGLLAIKRATLQIGDYVVNDINDVGRINSLVELGTLNGANKSKLHSHYFLNNFHTKVLESGGTTVLGANFETAQGGEGTIIYDRARSAIDFSRPNGPSAIGAEFGAKINNCIIADSEAATHQIGIPLGTLFPALKGQELPLFLFQDYRIIIAIEFHTSEKWCNSINSAENFVAPYNAVIPSEVKLQVDYLIYPSEIQNKLRAQTNAQGGLNLAFMDIIKIEKQLPEAPGASSAPPIMGQAQKVEHRLGMDNREVHKIYMMKKYDGFNQANRLFLNAVCDGQTSEEYNVNIDGVDTFQEYKWSPSSQYDEATNCLGSDLILERPIYFKDENTIFSRLADEKGGLLGKVKPLCLDLSNGGAGVVGAGRQIGAYPIIWKYNRHPSIEVPNANIGGGAAGNIIENEQAAMSVDYFVFCSRTVNVSSTPNGTAVMVSY